MNDALRQRLKEALGPLPDAEGGLAIVLASAGPPPALALLSSGDVWVDGDTVRVVTYGESSASQRLGGSFSLAVPAGEEVLRVEVVEASARRVGNLAVLEGRLEAIRPTAEPPWRAELTFRRDPGSEDQVNGFLAYWAAVRIWLQAGATGNPPTPTI